METKKVVYKTKGVCCSKISYMLAGNKICNVRFYGGCHGNGQGLARLLEGMDIEEVIKRLEGINCENKGTSCPDQLATALVKNTSNY